MGVICSVFFPALGVDNTCAVMSFRGDLFDFLPVLGVDYTCAVMSFLGGDLFDFLSSPGGCTTTCVDGGFGDLFDFSVQSWGLSDLHRSEVLGVISLTLFPVLGVEQRPA